MSPQVYPLKSTLPISIVVQLYGIIRRGRRREFRNADRIGRSLSLTDDTPVPMTRVEQGHTAS